MPRSPRKRSRRSSSSSSSSSSNSRTRRSRRRSPRRSPRPWSYGRDRGRSSNRRRSRSRETPRRPPKDYSPVPERPIASEDPKYLNARIFVGHLPSDRVDKDELEKHFHIYGKILEASVHPRGYGFVQFVKEEDARMAVQKEQRSLIKGSIIDVKMAADGRRDRTMMRDRLRGASPYTDHQSSYPPRDRDRDRDRDPAPRGPPPRDRSPVRDPYDDRFRDPYRESRDQARAPPPRDARDPYYDDPYRRPPPPDPYYDRYRDDPYRRDPYAADPYRDPYRDPYYEPPPRKPPPAECVVVLMKSQLRAFGDSIERKVKALNVITDIVVIPEDKTLAQQIEDISRHGGLFAIVVNSQNELHHSLTLNILHGSPQEHRNMPVEDAMNLIGRSFEKYLQSLKEKAAGGTTPAIAPPTATPAAVSAGRTQPFLPPSKDVSYLLNLLADNRQLTLEELDKVILYLRDRRDKMLDSERRSSGAGDVSYRDAVSPPEEGLLQQQQQQELQTKILSILNGSGQPTPGGNTGPPHMSSHGQPPPVAPASGGGGVNTALINFDNPSVQKALDNLIQSGPNLLRNISAASTSQNVPGGMSGPNSGRDLSSRPGLLSTPPGGPRQQAYPQQGMGGSAPPMRGMAGGRPRY